ARTYDGDAGKYRRQALGDYGSLTGNDVFAAAKKDAEAFADKVETGGIRQDRVETIADACRSYLSNIEDANGIAEGVFRRHVFPDAIGKLRLEKLRRHHLLAWRKRLEAAPAKIGRSKKGNAKVKP